MLILLNRIILTIFISAVSFSASSEEMNTNYLKTDWSFKGIFGTFDRASLQRGYQVYQEVCSGCHSVQHLSYRNLSEKGGPEFSVEEAKAIAAQFEVEDGVMKVPSGPGIGVDLDLDRIQSLTVREASFS